jgi:hypothetical protein
MPWSSAVPKRPPYAISHVPIAARSSPQNGLPFFLECERRKRQSNLSSERLDLFGHRNEPVRPHHASLFEDFREIVGE